MRHERAIVGAWHDTEEATLQSAVARIGQSAKAKLNNPSAVGAPEDQLRAPFEQLLADLAAFAGYAAGTVVAVGETSLAELRTRPDYAVTLHGALAGFVEIKAPGKGADPRRLKGAHDKAQWTRLQSLPNLLYTDRNEFSLWRHGEPAATLVRLQGDVETSGDKPAPGTRWRATPTASRRSPISWLWRCRPSACARTRRLATYLWRYGERSWREGSRF